MKDFFAYRLSQLRQAKDVSARELSLSIGNNPNYINRIENKIAYPKMEHFFNICDVLGITPHEFFNDGISYPIQSKDICTDLNKLSQREIETVQEVIKTILEAKK